MNDGCVGCGKSAVEVAPFTLDARLPETPRSLDAAAPVLGPYLGGGVVGTGLGAGNIGKPGGRLTPEAVHVAASPDLGLPYPAVRHDLLFDFSTPTLIFQRDRFIDPALSRELGGMVE